VTGGQAPGRPLRGGSLAGARGGRPRSRLASMTQNLITGMLVHSQRHGGWPPRVAGPAPRRDRAPTHGPRDRQRHLRDRRAFLVWPTESGRTAKIEAVAILDEQQRCFLAPLTAAERQQLGALL